MKNRKVVIYTMDDCIICKKAKDLFDLWNIEYLSYNIKPYINRPYPFFDIDDVLYEYKDIIKMIATGKLGSV